MRVPKDHYPFRPRFEKSIAVLSSCDPRFYRRTSYAVDPELLKRPECKLAMRAIKSIEAESGKTPDDPGLVVQHLERWRHEGKVTVEEVDDVEDMFDQVLSNGTPPMEGIESELVPILRRRIQKEAARSASEEYGKGSVDLGRAAELIQKANKLGTEAASAGPVAEAVVVTAEKVQAEHVRWLWRGRIPLGKLTVLDGDPGLGKSTLALDIAARVSSGRAMPLEEDEESP